MVEGLYFLSKLSYKTELRLLTVRSYFSVRQYLATVGLLFTLSLAQSGYLKTSLASLKIALRYFVNAPLHRNSSITKYHSLVNFRLMNLHVTCYVHTQLFLALYMCVFILNGFPCVYF